MNYVFPISTGSMNEKTDAKPSSLFEITGNRSGEELDILTSMPRAEEAKSRIEPEKSPQVKYANDIRKGMLHTTDSKEYPYSLGQYGLIELALLCGDYYFEEDGVHFGGLASEDLEEINAET